MSRYSGCWTGFKIVSDVADSGKRYDTEIERLPIIIPNSESLGEYKDLPRNILYEDTPRDQDYRLQEQKDLLLKNLYVQIKLIVLYGKIQIQKWELLQQGNLTMMLEALRWLGIDEHKARDLGLCIYKGRDALASGTTWH